MANSIDYDRKIIYFSVSLSFLRPLPPLSQAVYYKGYISEEENNPFTKPTYVNCNGIEFVEWEVFAEMYNSNKVKFKGTLDGDSY